MLDKGQESSAQERASLEGPGFLWSMHALSKLPLETAKGVRELKGVIERVIESTWFVLDDPWLAFADLEHAFLVQGIL